MCIGWSRGGFLEVQIATGSIVWKHFVCVSEQLNINQSIVYVLVRLTNSWEFIICHSLMQG